jgi:hypothetical protein
MAIIPAVIIILTDTRIIQATHGMAGITGGMETGTTIVMAAVAADMHTATVASEAGKPRFNWQILKKVGMWHTICCNYEIQYTCSQHESMAVVTAWTTIRS